MVWKSEAFDGDVPSGPADPAWRAFWASFEQEFGAELRRTAASILRRRGVGPRAEDLAEDGVQSFLVQLMKRKRIGAMHGIRNPQRFVQRALRHHLWDRYRWDRAQCRCPRGRRVPLEALSRETVPPSDDGDAEAWLRPAIERAVERLRNRTSLRNWEIVRELLATADGGPPSRVLARRYGVTPNALAQATFRARRALRAELQRAIFDLCCDPEVAEERWRWIQRRIDRRPRGR